jgi:hypothetical protein
MENLPGNGERRTSDLHALGDKSVVHVLIVDERALVCGGIGPLLEQEDVHQNPQRTGAVSRVPDGLRYLSQAHKYTAGSSMRTKATAKAWSRSIDWYPKFPSRVNPG